MILKKAAWKIMPLIGLFLLVGMIPTFGQSAHHYPGSTWEVLTPEQADIDPSKLQEFIRYVCKDGNGTAIFVSRFGNKINLDAITLKKIDANNNEILTPLNSNDSENRDFASAGKGTYAHFFFKAREEYKINNLHFKVAGLEWPTDLYDRLGWKPEDLNTLNPNWTSDRPYKDKDITWYHMVNQISCYGVMEYPGEAFCYSDYQIALFWDLLFQGVYGANIKNDGNADNVDEKVLLPFFRDQLGCQNKPTYLEPGKNVGRLFISAQDFARFGLLYMYGGLWNGNRLISEFWVNRAATDTTPTKDLPRSTFHLAPDLTVNLLNNARSLGNPKPDARDISDHKGSYGWLWLKNGEYEVNGVNKRKWPGVPNNTFGCSGHGGTEGMFIIPDLDIVVAWQNSLIEADNNNDNCDKPNVAKALQLLKDAIGIDDTGDLPTNPIKILPRAKATLTTTRPTFTWEVPDACPAVDSYIFQINNADGTTFHRKTYLSTTSYRMPAAKPLVKGNTYKWYVRAHNAVGWTAIGTGRTLTIQ